MNLESPLAELIDHCQTICLAACCGKDAYDFSPVQIASYLAMGRGPVNDGKIVGLRGQIEALKVNYGASGASAGGVAIDEMHQSFTGEEIDVLSEELLLNLEVALELLEISELRRYPGNAGRGGGHTR